MKTSTCRRIVAPGMAVTAILLIGLSAPLEAAPVLWEPDFGSALPALTGQDTAVQNVLLSFSFPFADGNYNSVYVSTDGYLNLGGNAGYPFADPRTSDLLDSSAPLISPFFADMDLLVNGTVYFKDFGNRAVFTWNQVGSWVAPNQKFSFQTTLLSDGSVRFSYNGIPDTLLYIDTNLLVGIGPGNGAADPGQTNLSGAPLLSGSSTVYELFERGQKGFDLDGTTLAFTPQAVGFAVSVVPEPSTMVLFFGGVTVCFAARRVARRKA